jgi:hypothetical protein
MKKALLVLGLLLWIGVGEAGELVGTIAKVATRTFTVKRGDLVKEFSLQEGAEIRKGNRKLRLEELQVGQEVKVVFTEEGQRAVAQQVEVLEKPKADRPHAQN